MAKRFYKSVAVKPAGDGYAVTLDGRELKTPGKCAMHLPKKGLAELVAQEWDAQTEDIVPADMPVTRLLNVAIERTPDHRDEVVQEARNYAGTDLLCYLAPDPRDLTKRQISQWEPWLDWAAARGVKLTATEGIVAVEQDAKSLDAVADYASGLSDIDLTLFVHFTATLGSAVLAMAVMARALPINAAFDLSRLDEAYQIELWGEDEDAQIRTENIRKDLLALGQILDIKDA